MSREMRTLVVPEGVAGERVDSALTRVLGLSRTTIARLLDDGEMIFGAINYWEGPVVVAATVAGKKVKGVGFMELAGYPSDYNFLFLAGKKVNARVQKEIGARLKDFWG